jgi:phage shock protein E
MGSHAAPAEQVPSDAGHKLVPASFTPKDEPPLTLELGSSSATMDGPSFTTEDDTPFTPTDAPAPTLVNMEQLQVIFPPPEAGQSEDRLAADTAQQLAEPKDRMHITPSPPESGQFGDPRQGNSAVPDAVNKPLAEHNNSLLSSLPPDAAHELAEPAMVARANPGEGRMGVQRGGGWKRNGSHSSLSSLATLDSDEESESVGAHPFAPGANSFGAGTDSSGAGPDALAAGPDALAAGEGSSAVGPNSLGAGHHVVAREEANLDAADDTPLIEVDTMVAYHDAAPPKEPFPAASDDTPLIEVDKMVAGHDAAAPEEPFPAASDDTPRSVMAQPETPAGMRTNDEARAASAAPSEKLEMPVAPSVPEAVCNPGPRQQIPETRTIDEARATSAAPSEKLETPIAPPVEESVSKPGPKQQIPETPPPAAALPDPAATYRIGGFADAAAAGPAAARDSDPAGDPALARKEADSTSKLVHVAAGTDAVVKQAANQVAEGTRANETASNRPAEMGAPVASAPAIASRSELGRALMAYGTILLDVRAAAERAAAPLPIPSVSCPVGLEAPGCDELLARAPKLLPRTNTPVVAFCGSGRRAAVAIAALETMGYSKLLNGGSADNVLACLMAGS